MRISPNELVIRGNWVVSGKAVTADTNCKRIEALIGDHLKEVARSATGWETLYVDPDDGRFWELTYPHSEMHGGGPPMLTHLSVDLANRKYPQLLRSDQDMDPKQT